MYEARLTLLPSHLFFHLLLYLFRLLFYLLLRFLCFLFYLSSLFLHLLFYLSSPLLHLFFYPLLYLLLDRTSARRCAGRQYESGHNERGESFHVFSSSFAQRERKSIRAVRQKGCGRPSGETRLPALSPAGRNLCVQLVVLDYQAEPAQITPTPMVENYDRLKTFGVERLRVFKRVKERRWRVLARNF